MSEYLLEARELTKEFPAAGKKTVHAVSGVSLQIRKGETLGLVGESGCGKSTLGRLLIRTLQPTSGEVLFRGQSVTRMKDSEFKPLRKEMQLVFQDPYASLDPRMTVRDLVAEPIETWKLYGSREEVTERVRELLRAVGVPEEFLHRYPHQFSGGQRQRIGSAMISPWYAISRTAYASCFLGRSAKSARRKKFMNIRDIPIPASCWTRCRCRIPRHAGSKSIC